MITIDQTKKLAKQSRLFFTDEGLTKMNTMLNEFLEEIDKLTLAETDSVGISYPLSMDADDLREDVAVESMDREKLLKNAPEHTDGAFVVPSAVE